MHISEMHACEMYVSERCMPAGEASLLQIRVSRGYLSIHLTES